MSERRRSRGRARVPVGGPAAAAPAPTRPGAQAAKEEEEGQGAIASPKKGSGRASQRRRREEGQERRPGEPSPPSDPSPAMAELDIAQREGLRTVAAIEKEEAQGATASPKKGSGRGSQRRRREEGQERRPGEPSPPSDQSAAMPELAFAEREGQRTERQNYRFARYIEPRTRPVDRLSKTGTEGTPVNLRCNYFRVETPPDWIRHQYHVSFAPYLDSLKIRRVLIGQQALGDWVIFDGSVLYLRHKLPDSLVEPQELSGQREDGTSVQITLKYTGKILPGDPTSLHLYNIALRQIQGFMNMTQIGRHFFSPSEKLSIPEHGNPNIDGLLNKWELSISDQVVHIDGRVLPCEKIRQGRHVIADGHNGDWSRGMRGARLNAAIPVSHWLLIYSAIDERIVRPFVEALIRVGEPMGIDFSCPTRVPVRDKSTRSYLTAIKQCMNDETQLVVCVLSSSKKDLYDAIKKYCCKERPVPSQVVLSGTLEKRNMLMSVATKIAIQINCKLGGEAWAVDIPVEDLMVIGMDVYHDSMTKGRSVSAFVASLNQNLTRYYSRCGFQHQHQELTDNLQVCLTGALKEYHRLNHKLPSNIVFYRDGVGDGQLAQVIDFEIPRLLECLKRIGQDKIGLAFVVVKKRINTRLFAQGPGGHPINPSPGTIVDTMLTKPESYDFFLVSQSVRQGTVSPVNYNIIWDTINWTPNFMQRLTYKLTHLYYNWPGTIRVPAPCQYAHKMAFLVGQSLHTDPAIELANQLYYL